MTRIKLNYFVIGIIALLLALALWPNIPWRNGQEGQLDRIKARGELRVSTISSPLIYSTGKDGPSGLDYELTQRFADYLGVKLVMTPHHNINDLFDALDSDDADLIAAGLIYNRERLNRARTGPAYYSVSQQLVYRLGAPRPKSFSDLKGQLIVASGSAHMTTLKQLKQTKYPDLNWGRQLIAPAKNYWSKSQRASSTIPSAILSLLRCCNAFTHNWQWLLTLRMKSQ